MLDSKVIAQAQQHFVTLGIEPTIDRKRIIGAFRSQAKKCHPDLCRDAVEKERCHTKFIDLTTARDGILKLIAHPDFLATLAGDVKPAPVPASPSAGHPDSRESDYEEEWKVFVDDANAYFRLITSTHATFVFMIHAACLGVGIGVTLGLLAVLELAFVATVIILLVAALSASVAIPAGGWYLGIKLVIATPGWTRGLTRSIRRRFETTATSTLRVVAKTGFPTRAFWASFVAALTAAIGGAAALFACGQNGLGWTVVVVACIMTVAMLQVHESISERLRRMDEAFSKIRGTRSYALMVLA